MIHVVTWLWRQANYRHQFTPAHVNTLYNMVARNLTLPFQFVCFTDQMSGLYQTNIWILPLPKTPEVKWGSGRPNCFRRLWLFSKEAQSVLDNRIVNMDLDCVVVGSLDPLFSRQEEFIGWRDTCFPGQYNGSLWMLTAGSHPRVWDEWKGNASLPRLRGKAGSDQAWISMMLGKHGPVWTAKDGVYSYKREVVRLGGLPSNARLVIFHGSPSPWQVGADWVRTHYR